MRLSWIILVSPKCHSKCLYKREAEGDYTHRKGGNVIHGDRITVMQPGVKECWQLPGVRRGKEWILSRASGGVWPW